MRVLANLHPKQTIEETDASLRNAGAKTIQSWLRELFPDRLAAAVLDLSETSGQTACAQLTKAQRLAVRTTIHQAPLRFEGDRGWHHAEVTMGGVPLSEIRWQTMESKVAGGLHLCGEILDVDGRIGGLTSTAQQWLLRATLLEAARSLDLQLRYFGIQQEGAVVSHAHRFANGVKCSALERLRYGKPLAYDFRRNPPRAGGHNRG